MNQFIAARSPSPAKKTNTMNTKYYHADDDISTHSKQSNVKSGKSPLKSTRNKELKLPSKPVKPVFESSEERILFHQVLQGGNVLDNVSKCL